VKVNVPAGLPCALAAVVNDRLATIGTAVVSGVILMLIGWLVPMACRRLRAKRDARRRRDARDYLDGLTRDELVELLGR
jgi:xanthine/uracil permease